MRVACRSVLVVMCLLFVACATVSASEVAIAVGEKAGPAGFGLAQLEQALQETGAKVRRVPLGGEPAAVAVARSRAEAESLGIAGSFEDALGAEGFRIVRPGKSSGPALAVIAADDRGAMYGLLDLAEQVRSTGSLEKASPRTASARFPFRAVKFNLPYASYRQHESLRQHEAVCRDLEFWREFLDAMARNRFNTLTLWSLHPFHYMIRPKNYPEACDLSDSELAEWQTFWRKLFAMAKERGIDTYLVDWNVFVSPAFAEKHGVAQYSRDWGYFGDADRSEIVQRYNRECVTQVIDEYDDLAGLGVSLGERMGGMTPAERERWILDTVVAGMRQAKRKARLIHRVPFSANLGSGGSTDASTEQMTRQALESIDLPGPIWVEAKFNWSHGHSTPELVQVHGGKISDAYWNPPSKNYRVAWMARNEDFFCLRWGEPDFIRRHIAQNGPDYVGGYFVGSECYIPAANYFTRGGREGSPRWAFQRQWLFYMLWGRLLYDPATPDEVFRAEFQRRYGPAGQNLLEAYTLASRMPLRLASLYKSSWDFTLYSEGFMAPSPILNQTKGRSAFISVDHLIEQPVLDPRYVSIKQYVEAGGGKEFADDRITPPRLAEMLEADGRRALSLVASISANDPVLVEEVGDVKAWAHLSLYFAEKLRGGVALCEFRRNNQPGQRQQAIAHLEKAAKHWDDLIAVTEPLYREMPLVHLSGRDVNFHWSKLRGDVAQDTEIARQAK